MFGGLLLLGGRSGDLLGRRRIFITGILVFAGASLLGGFATDQAWLRSARAPEGTCLVWTRWLRPPTERAQRAGSHGRVLTA